MMSNETDTCQTYIFPKLYAAGWEDDYITKQLVLRTVETVALFRFEGAVRDALLPSPYGDNIPKGAMSMLDRAFKGEL
jgi:hypothetical protein